MATSLGRKCVLMRWADVSMETVLDLVERGAGSLLLLLPQNFTEMEGETVEVGSLAEPDCYALQQQSCTVLWCVTVWLREAGRLVGSIPGAACCGWEWSLDHVLWKYLHVMALLHSALHTGEWCV